MKVIVTRAAQVELLEIWNYNAEHKSLREADSYLSFLDNQIDGLSGTFAEGKTIGTRPDLRYIEMRRHTGGHAHVAVYSIQGDRVIVAHVFHTAQNWKNKLAEE